MAQGQETTEVKVYEVPEAARARAHIKSWEEYRKLYKRSVDDPEGFWAEVAERVTWYKKWDSVLKWDFTTAKIEWLGARSST
jgi:acetyl-CoA synthetase